MRAGSGGGASLPEEEMEFVPRNRPRAPSLGQHPMRGYSFTAGLREIILCGPLNLLLLAIPALLASLYLGGSDVLRFVLSLLALAPAAERLGYVTEQLALHTNDTIGGLLNATFGNLTEMIVGLSALFHGYFRLVQLSLLGSILSNLLLVLGSSFFVGGMRFHIQRHAKVTSQINSSLLMVTTMGLLYPTILTLSEMETSMGELELSRGSAVIMLSLYAGFLYYQLFIPLNAYNQASKQERWNNNQPPILPGYQTMDSEDNDHARLMKTFSSDNDEDEDDEEDTLGFTYALFWLGVITLVITFLSNIIVDSVTAAASHLHISSVFLSAIIIPIVGNAAEHASAITFGYKNRLELSLGIAVGSSTQIGLMVLPLMTVVGWCFDLPMSFNFSSYEATTLLLTIITITFALKDGKSNFLLGMILMGAYGIIALGFWAHVDEGLSGI